MENGWSLFNINGSTSQSSGSTSRGGQNGHCTNHAWDIWELGTTPRFDWSTTTTTPTLTPTPPTNHHHHHHNNNNNSFLEKDAPPSATTATAYAEARGDHALMFAHEGHNAHHHQAASLYAGGGPLYHPDPHLMCLKLGKRHYFGEAIAPPLIDRHVEAKRVRPYYGGDVMGPGPSTSSSAVTVAAPTAVVVPRCQVEGCHVALANAKDYHRRHKVCEMHSKAPKVVVLGLEQRFCQQCSRFHAVTEFDDSKRSCRRRLAGHNERRRKGSHDSLIPRNPSQGRAHSLLSIKNNPWFSSADLSSRCSAALRELIAENRAAILSRQLVLDRDSWHHHRHHHTIMDEDVNGSQLPESSNPLLNSHHQMFPEPHGWDRFSESGGGHVTLDLMQAPSSAFGFLSVRGKSKEEEEECSELWRSFGGAHLV